MEFIHPVIASLPATQPISVKMVQAIVRNISSGLQQRLLSGEVLTARVVEHSTNGAQIELAGRIFRLALPDMRSQNLPTYITLRQQPAIDKQTGNETKPIIKSGDMAVQVRTYGRSDMRSADIASTVQTVIPQQARPAATGQLSVMNGMLVRAEMLKPTLQQIQPQAQVQAQPQSTVAALAPVRPTVGGAMLTSVTLANSVATGANLPVTSATPITAAQPSMGSNSPQAHSSQAVTPQPTSSSVPVQSSVQPSVQSPVLGNVPAVIPTPTVAPIPTAAPAATAATQTTTQIPTQNAQLSGSSTTQMHPSQQVDQPPPLVQGKVAEIATPKTAINLLLPKPHVAPDSGKTQILGNDTDGLSRQRSMTSGSGLPKTVISPARTTMVESATVPHTFLTSTTRGINVGASSAQNQTRSNVSAPIVSTPAVSAPAVSTQQGQIAKPSIDTAAPVAKTTPTNSLPSPISSPKAVSPNGTTVATEQPMVQKALPDTKIQSQSLAQKTHTTATSSLSSTSSSSSQQGQQPVSQVYHARLAQNYQQIQQNTQLQSPNHVSALTQWNKIGQTIQLQMYDPRLVPSSTTTFQGTVEGTDPVGRTIVHISRGQIALQLPQSLPEGTILSLQETGALHPAASRHRFSALESLLSSVPSAVGQAARSAMPQPNMQMTSSMLFFLLALRQNSGLQSFWGNNVHNSLLSQQDMLAAAEEEFNIAQPSPLQSDTSWQSYSLPLQVGSEIVKFLFYWRGGNGQSDSDDAQEKNIFAVEGYHRDVGRFRLDGQFLRPKLNIQWASDRALDIATEKSLSALYQQHSELYGITGQLQFFLLGDRSLWIDRDAHQDRLQV